MTEAKTLTLSTPVPVKYDEALHGPESPEDGIVETTEIHVRPLQVGDCQAAPAGELELGELLEVAAAACGIVGEVQAAFRKMPAAQIGPLVTLVENGLEVYHKAAEGMAEELADRGFDEAQTYTLTLGDPVQFGSETVSSLELQPLTAGHLWKLPTGRALTLYETAQLGGRMAAVSSGVIDRLGMKDAGRLNAVATAFLAGFRKTGN